MAQPGQLCICLSDIPSVTPLPPLQGSKGESGVSAMWRLRPEGHGTHFFHSTLTSHFQVMGRRQALSEHSNRARKGSPAFQRRCPPVWPSLYAHTGPFLSKDYQGLPSTYLFVRSFRLQENSVR